MCHLFCRIKEWQCGLSVVAYGLDSDMCMFFLNRKEKWMIVCLWEIASVSACSMSTINYGVHWGFNWLSPPERIYIWNSKVRTNVFLCGRVPGVAREISLSYFTCQTLKKDSECRSEMPVSPWVSWGHSCPPPQPVTRSPDQSAKGTIF